MRPLSADLPMHVTAFVLCLLRELQVLHMVGSRRLCTHHLGHDLIGLANLTRELFGLWQDQDHSTGGFNSPGRAGVKFRWSLGKSAFVAHVTAHSRCPNHFLS